MNVAIKQRREKWTMYIRESQLNILLLQCIPISDCYLAMLVHYLIDLKSAHDRMVLETRTRPFYGNDTVKEFLRSFIRFCLFDKAHRFEV